MGRPKGSKNKPKVTLTDSPVPDAQAEELPKTHTVESTGVLEKLQVGKVAQLLKSRSESSQPVTIEELEEAVKQVTTSELAEPIPYEVKSIASTISELETALLDFDVVEEQIDTLVLAAKTALLCPSLNGNLGDKADIEAVNALRQALAECGIDYRTLTDKEL